MAQNKYPIRRNGYIYSAGTAAGFTRMKRLGIPRPPIAQQNKLAKHLQIQYRKAIKNILKEFKAACLKSGISDLKKITQDDPGDTIQELLDFFDEMGRQEEAAEKANQEALLRSQLETARQELESMWTIANDQEQTEIDQSVEKIFEKTQETFLQQFLEDADERTRAVFTARDFSIDKKKNFEANMAGIKHLYLNNAMERNKYEMDYFRRRFLEELNNYITGVTDRLDTKRITAGLNASAKTYSHFFARDQLARFNKANTIASLLSAGCTKVMWHTCHDVRVRKSHKNLDGLVFDINNLPPEIDDFNCRCGLSPVAFAD